MITVLQGYFKKTLKRWGFTFGAKKINVDEDLPNFFKAVRFSDAEWYQAEIEYLQKEYGFDIETKRVLDEIDRMKPNKKNIQGCPYYLVLANPIYYNSFAYLPASLPNRDNLIMDDDDEEGNDCEQSDMVSIILNMAYVPEYVLESFEFKKGFHETFGPAVKKYKLG